MAMRYFVISPDGHRYGPADLATLSQWVREGRILPNHELEAEGTGQRVRADMIPGLFQGTQTQQYIPPMQTPGPTVNPTFYPRPLDPIVNVERTISQSWNMGIAGIACTVLLGIMPCCGTAFAIAGGIFGARGLAHGLDAKRMGSDRAQAPIIFNAVVIVLAILAALGSLSFRHLIRF